MAHRIAVDDDVMEALKSRAEPFVDTPNSVLRRVLLHEEQAPPRRTAETVETLGRGALPKVKWGTPKALEQILHVAYLVKNASHTRIEATHEVARQHGVTFQTVLDKYSRQLALSTDQFDDLLAEPTLRELKSLLTARFDRHQDSVVDTLG